MHIVRTVSECCPCLLDLLDPTCCRLRVDCSFSSLHDPARLYTVYLRNAPFHVHCRWSYIETPRIECRCSRKSGLLIRLVCGTKRGYGQCAIYVTCSISSSAAYLKLQTKLHHPQTTLRLRKPYPRNISNMFKRIFGEVKLPSIASTTHC